MSGDWFWLLLFVIVGYFLINADWSNDKKTVYVSHCPDYKSSFKECYSNLSYSQKTFLAIPQTQTIISYSNGFINRYEDCTVFDKENWFCKIDWDGDELPDYYNMQDGVYGLSVGDGNSQPYYRAISRIEYYFSNLIKFFKNF